MLDEEHADLQEEDENTYALGTMSGHNFAIVCLPANHIGNNLVAAVAMQMRRRSCQSDKILNGVVQDDFGKTVPSGFERMGALKAAPLGVTSNSTVKIQQFAYASSRDAACARRYFMLPPHTG
ncbi:hypothetical protein B0J11DRAFT_512073 [Dendryphion nanum]|uniref:Uncharacterized protein n=1 Tax=Dendryphion nanum TaxID=256645 RepID=A0A9P9I9V1_9PLEO|nr:hypothetical protein B0J11DRAFT_512073 [Dendryphion nanum]